MASYKDNIAKVCLECTLIAAQCDGTDKGCKFFQITREIRIKRPDRSQFEIMRIAESKMLVVVEQLTLQQAKRAEVWRQNSLRYYYEHRVEILKKGKDWRDARRLRRARMKGLIKTEDTNARIMSSCTG